MGLELKTVIGRIISLQAMQYPGSYLDAWTDDAQPKPKVAHVTECDYTDVPNAEWTRFIVHEGSNGSMILESLKFRDLYVDAYDDRMVHLTHSPVPPVGETWAEWELIVVEDAIVNIKSRRYGGFLDSWLHKEVKVTDGDPAKSWAQWRLGIGPGEGIEDGYELVASLRNDLDIPVTMTYKHGLGISVQESTSTTYTTTLAMEMQKNFGVGPISLGHLKMSVSFSAQWQSSTSQTWSETEEISASVDVPAKKKVLVNQLKGRYGPLMVNSLHLQIEYADCI